MMNCLNEGECGSSTYVNGSALPRGAGPQPLKRLDVLSRPPNQREDERINLSIITPTS